MKSGSNRDYLELLLHKLEGNLSLGEEIRLRDHINNDPNGLDTYVETAILHALLLMPSRIKVHPDLTRISLNDSSIYDALISALVESERDAPAVILPRNMGFPVIIETENSHRIPRTINKLGLFSGVATAAAMLILIAVGLFTLNQGDTGIATVVGQVDARWSAKHAPIVNNQRLFGNQGPLDLQEGLTQIVTDRGVILTIEAPARFEFGLNGNLELYYGHLFAHVPPEGIGFTVVTAHSKVIDLGTEFGVYTDRAGSTQLHVFAGKTDLIAEGPDVAPYKRTVVRDEAMSVSSDGIDRGPIPIRNRLFARTINTGEKVIWRGEPLYLGDMVGGGMGFGGGRPGFGLDPRTGSAGGFLRFRESGDYTYHRVPNHTFIDGVFVPDGSRGAVQVSSTGLLYQNAPATGNVCTTSIIQNKHGRPLSMSHRHATSLSENHAPKITMHPNHGITFDLQAIADHYAGLKPVRVAGAIYLVGNDDELRQEVLNLPDDYYPRVDFIVLIDGQEHFARWDITHDTDGDTFDIELPETARFLTLMVTDGSDDRSLHCFCSVIAPRLHLIGDADWFTPRHRRNS